MVKAASTSPAQRPQPGISLQPWKVVESSGIKHWDHDFARLGVNDLFFARWTVPWKVKGTGKYRFHLCSDDGSDLIITDSRGKVVEGIDGQKSSGKIINNDGLHGRRCYTGSAALKDGETYVLEVNFFENHGGANCQLDFTYEPTALPELEAGELMGEGTFPYIELKRNHDLRVIVPQTPHYNYMWRYTGQVVIREAGNYIFCDSSDDGSKIWFDDKLQIDNDGRHSEREVCRSLDMKASTIKVEVHGFSLDHHCVQKFKYSGPDTNGVKVLVNAVGTKPKD
jgi:hypothetical protein